LITPLRHYGFAISADYAAASLTFLQVFTVSSLINIIATILVLLRVHTGQVTVYFAVGHITLPPLRHAITSLPDSCQAGFH
jgi:hypothetical protein